MVNGPPGTSTSAGSRRASGGGGRAAPRLQHGGAPAQLVGDEHGLVVLLLVLGDHAEGEARR